MGECEKKCDDQSSEISYKKQLIDLTPRPLGLKDRHFLIKFSNHNPPLKKGDDSRSEAGDLKIFKSSKASKLPQIPLTNNCYAILCLPPFSKGDLNHIFHTHLTIYYF